MGNNSCEPKRYFFHLSRLTLYETIHVGCTVQLDLVRGWDFPILNLYDVMHIIQLCNPSPWRKRSDICLDEVRCIVR
jgi:hypothetical protein